MAVKKQKAPQRDIHIRIDEDVAAWIDEKADKVGRSVANELRRTLRRAYEPRKHSEA
jgi:hypothetical protein